MDSKLKTWIYFIIVVMFIRPGKCQLTTDVLWDSCGTIICGMLNLQISCETNSKLLINNVTSGLGQAFDEISYLNLRRMCMGMTSCDPRRSGFCEQHNNAAQFNVSYTCIKEEYIDNSCGGEVKMLTNKSGFISSPSYPAETNSRNCKWKIVVPPKHYVHVFLHEVLPKSPAKCSEIGEGGLRFATNNNCVNRFPTFPICSESSMEFSISACNTTEIWLPWSTLNVRFLLSYYVVETPDLRYVDLYDTEITCVVRPKDVFIYRSPEPIDTPTNSTDSTDAMSPNGTVHVDRSRQGDDDDIDYVAYIGLGVGIVVIIVLIVIVIMFIRCRYMNAFGNIEKRDDLSNSNSQTNCSEIQKRPLPDCVSEIEEAQDSPVLQQSYSRVADEIPQQTTQQNMTSPTYAEIVEYSETGMKPKLPLVNKRSVDNSKRKLPAKPDEAQASIYSEIEDAEAKDVDTEKSVQSKNKKNQECIDPKILNKKKLSNASNIYDECQDVAKIITDKTYMDMSHKKVDESEYVPHHKFTKETKDKANQSKKCRVTDKLTNQSIVYADCEEKTNGPAGKESGSKLKKESVTSESDSDEDICIVENELYEPFESAKV